MTRPKYSIQLQLSDSVHVNVLFIRRMEAGRARESADSDHAHQSLLHHTSQTSSAYQIFRPQSLKNPLAMWDSLNVTVRELRVTSVTVTSAERTAGLHDTPPTTWSPPRGISDGATWSVLPAEFHSGPVSCAESGKMWLLVEFV